jgi:hypothetical protein
MKDFPAPAIYLPDNKLLSTGILLVTLTVKNRFDYIDSATAKVSLSQESEIKILFEQINENSCRQSAACQFSIKSVDSCLQNPVYEYEWDLINAGEFGEEVVREFWALQVLGC